MVHRPSSFLASLLLILVACEATPFYPCARKCTIYNIPYIVCSSDLDRVSITPLYSDLQPEIDSSTQTPGGRISNHQSHFNHPGDSSTQTPHGRISNHHSNFNHPGGTSTQTPGGRISNHHSNFNNQGSSAFTNANNPNAKSHVQTTSQNYGSSNSPVNFGMNLNTVNDFPNLLNSNIQSASDPDNINNQSGGQLSSSEDFPNLAQSPASSYPSAEPSVSGMETTNPQNTGSDLHTVHSADVVNRNAGFANNVQSTQPGAYDSRNVYQQNNGADFQTASLGSPIPTSQANQEAVPSFSIQENKDSTTKNELSQPQDGLSQEDTQFLMSQNVDTISQTDQSPNQNYNDLTNTQSTDFPNSYPAGLSAIPAETSAVNDQSLSTSPETLPVPQKYQDVNDPMSNGFPSIQNTASQSSSLASSPGITSSVNDPSLMSQGNMDVPNKYGFLDESNIGQTSSTQNTKPQDSFGIGSPGSNMPSMNGQLSTNSETPYNYVPEKYQHLSNMNDGPSPSQNTYPAQGSFSTGFPENSMPSINGQYSTSQESSQNYVPQKYLHFDNMNDGPSAIQNTYPQSSFSTGFPESTVPSVNDQYSTNQEHSLNYVPPQTYLHLDNMNDGPSAIQNTYPQSSFSTGFPESTVPSVNDQYSTNQEHSLNYVPPQLYLHLDNMNDGSPTSQSTYSQQPSSSYSTEGFSRLVNNQQTTSQQGPVSQRPQPFDPRGSNRAINSHSNRDSYEMNSYPHYIPPYLNPRFMDMYCGACGRERSPCFMEPEQSGYTWYESMCPGCEHAHDQWRGITPHYLYDN